MRLPEYQNRFRTAVVERDDIGVLTVRLTSWGGPLVWGGLPHRELAELFAAVAGDDDNRVVVITGTGDAFVTMPEGGPEALAAGALGATAWESIAREGHRLVARLLDIEVPVIAAVNGPVSAHSELAVLADIVLCTDDSWFQDAAHFIGGMVPGDGMQLIWPLLLGPNRGRSFLLTGEKLAAAEALRRGVVAEVLTRDRLMPRAHELAAAMAGQNPLLLRGTRAVLTRPLKRLVGEDLEFGLRVEALAAVSGAEWATPAEAGDDPEDD